jgi:predicted RNase H-like nuclease (RuvC/YqgF family)
LAKGDATTFTYEKPAVQVDLAAKNLNEPRMMTVKQIRDLFYSMMNTSTA